ncbi:ferulic acid decarboxylase 1 [Parachaetomium inaequale]|uniref:Ferulic acid decarboxylase 1 n=1 Tax=Parachaetomium inaequale TaxID=2588326 RepID=A0AAN6P604_9PEZI|nr:ferulic acid decarboxylase 1 [Parachaetomium inaequale]
MTSAAQSTAGARSPLPPHLEFRSFVEALREDGDLADIEAEVDPHLEVAAIIRRCYEKRAKAPLFNNVKGATEDGLFRVLGAPGGLSSDPHIPYRRLARHIGLPPDAGLGGIIDAMLAAKGKPLIPPVRVQTGPCKERKILGDDVDLTKLPSPLLNRADGGNYIQTLGVNIVPDVDGRWVNWSIARAMVHDKTRLDGIPFAIAMGAPPIATMAASMPLPAGVSEAEYVGALCGSPLELVKCETNDLLVPSTSEIVLEGTISLTETAKEGPFGEMHGYSFLDEADGLPQPIYNVKAITHRTGAILPVCVPGRAKGGPDETHTMIGTLAAAEMREQLQRAGLPVLQVFTPYETQVIWAVVQVDRIRLREMKTNAKALCTAIGDVVFRQKCGMQVHRVLVVGDDIDPFDFAGDVTWAFATRCRPAEDEFHFEDVPAYPLVPYVSHGPGTKLTGGKVVANCLLPAEYDYTPETQAWVTCDFANEYPEEVKERVLQRWEAFGL